ncbi:e3 ubiquitin-protein ligase trim23 [Anaeramoeba flamelloides]|uniref:E3 ubiquitin-protein ligase trim23 n=1 Tax=Anaeramoeba flamelloides TaxID=1746091 RepID=A0ABQ8X920_9EUKA|nr:e3 ubiquitin-protein ligase trim23 [Anaeramoeba flamelloides]
MSLLFFGTEPITNKNYLTPTTLKPKSKLFTLPKFIKKTSTHLVFVGEKGVITIFNQKHLDFFLSREEKNENVPVVQIETFQGLDIDEICCTKNHVLILVDGLLHQLDLTRLANDEKEKENEIEKEKEAESSLSKFELVKLGEETKISSISSGSNYFLALTEGGNVLYWEFERNSKISQNEQVVSTPTKIGTLPEGGIKKIGAGPEHVVVATTDNEIYSWGSNGFGQLGINSTEDQEAPTKVKSLPNEIGVIEKIVCGLNGTAIINEDNLLYVAGDSKLFGTEKLGNEARVSTFKQIEVDQGQNEEEDELVIENAVIGQEHTLFLTNEESVLCCGTNMDGKCGTGQSVELIAKPSPIKLDPAFNILDFCLGDGFSLVLLDTEENNKIEEDLVEKYYDMGVFESIHKDFFAQIIRYLDVGTLTKLSLTSSKINTFLSEMTDWHKVYTQKIGKPDENTTKKANNIGWFKTFVSIYGEYLSPVYSPNFRGKNSKTKITPKKSGGFFGSLKKMFKKPDIRCVMIGLDESGKTQILYKLKLGEVVTTIPTIGFNVENIERKKSNLVIWDIGGQFKLRTLWRHYYADTNVIIWVVDTNKSCTNVNDDKENFLTTLKDSELRNVKVLIYANKRDLESTIPTQELVKRYELNQLKHDWVIIPCSARTGMNLEKGLDWIESKFK